MSFDLPFFRKALSVGDWTPVERVKRNRMSPVKMVNSPGHVRKSANESTVQSTYKTFRSVRKKHRNPNRNITSIQNGPQLRRTREPKKAITVRDSSLIVRKLKDAYDTAFSLWNKNDKNFRG